MVWRVGRGPGDWKNAVIVPIHEKGSRMEYTNYRGNLSLMSIVGKVFARALNERVKVLTGEKVMESKWFQGWKRLCGSGFCDQTGCGKDNGEG